MRQAATALLRSLTGAHHGQATRRFDDESARRWIEYRPRPRPGLCLGDLDSAARKATFRLLATGLSPHAYAQAMAVIALEEVLDRREDWARGRHSNDYWVVVFGDPAGDASWGWRFEGHHLSLTMTIVEDDVSPAPLFLGANPARITVGGRTILAPLAPEQDIALQLLDSMTPALRSAAIVGQVAPPDIRSLRSACVAAPIEPVGASAGRLSDKSRGLLDELVHLYIGRLPAVLAADLTAGLAEADLHFAWEGAATAAGGHYYRIQAHNLLIEYDNTDNDANHCHTVLRRPLADFGHDILRAHRQDSHGDKAFP